MRAAPVDRDMPLRALVFALSLVVSCSRATPATPPGCPDAADGCSKPDSGITPDAGMPAAAGEPADDRCSASPQCGDDALCTGGRCQPLPACSADPECEASHGLCVAGRCRPPCSAAAEGCHAEHAGWTCAPLARAVCLPQGTFPGAACQGDDGCGAYLHDGQMHGLRCHEGACRLTCSGDAATACAQDPAANSCNAARALCLPARPALGSACDGDRACAGAEGSVALVCLAGHCSAACSDTGHWPGYASALCRTLGADFDCVSGVCRTPPSAPAGRIAAENALPGDAGWVLDQPAIAREIEGYADRASVNLGERLALYVHTREPSYSLQIFRLGHYSGAGARRVLGPLQRAGVAQVMPQPDADGFVECDWRDPYALTIPTDWVSGIYLAKLEAGTSHKQSYVVFVVRDDARASDYLFQSSVTSYQAYNNWGGKSLQDDNSSAGRRATRVSFNRPYALGSDPAGLGAGELLTPLWLETGARSPGWEYPLLRFLEREGYDVTYATSLDTHADPRLLQAHRAFLSAGRDAYWTWDMRSYVEQARDRFGTHLGFFSASTCSWQARLEPDAHGHPLRTLLAYKDASDPVAQTDQAYQLTTAWSEPPLDLSQVTFVGLSQQSSGVDDDLVVDDETSWALAGTDLRHGDRLPGLLGEAVDGAPPRLPAGYTRVMHSPFSAENVAHGHADMLTFAAPSGAWTFSAGSLQLVWGLDDYPDRFLPASRRQPAAEQLARNVLARLRSTPTAARDQTLSRERFDAAGFDTERMRTGIISQDADALDPTVGVRASAGQLEITPRERLSGLHYNGLVSARTWDLRDAAAQVTLAAVPTPESNAETSFALASDDTHWLRFTQSGQWLLFQIRGDFGLDTTATAYDPGAHRILRLRHERASDSWVWETSADGVQFAEQRRTSGALDASAMRWELSAGTFQTAETVGSAAFDDLSLVGSGYEDDFSGARRAELWTPGVRSEGDARHALGSVPIQHGSALSVRAPAAADSGSGYLSARAWDMTGGELRVELAQAAPSGARTVVALAADAGRWLRFEIEGDHLRCQDQLGDARSQTESPYDPAAHRHLRIAHHPGPDTLTWEVSPDGSDWTVLRTRAAGLSLAGLHAELALYATVPDSQATSVFRHFSLHSGIFDP